MKCPNCGYENEREFNAKHRAYVNSGEHGEFYEIEVKARRADRGSYYGDTEEQIIHGCPSCGIMFMDI